MRCQRGWPRKRVVPANTAMRRRWALLCKAVPLPAHSKVEDSRLQWVATGRSRRQDWIQETDLVLERNKLKPQKEQVTLIWSILKNVVCSQIYKAFFFFCLSSLWFMSTFSILNFLGQTQFQRCSFVFRLNRTEKVQGSRGVLWSKMFWREREGRGCIFF